MPLRKLRPPRTRDRCRKNVSRNIALLMDEGRPQKQAVAIALSHARRQGCRIKDTRKGRAGGQSWREPRVVLTRAPYIVREHPGARVKFRYKVEGPGAPPRGLYRHESFDWIEDHAPDAQVSGELAEEAVARSIERARARDAHREDQTRRERQEEDRAWVEAFGRRSRSAEPGLHLDLVQVKPRGRAGGRWPLAVIKDRLFIGVFPAGIGYADRARTVEGDYARVGFLPFKTLVFEPARGADPRLVAEAREHADKIAARRGETFEVSASGQTVVLGRSCGCRR